MQICDVAVHQLRTLFLLTDSQAECIESVQEAVLYQTKNSLAGFNNKYVSAELNPFNSVIYCQYLYWLSRTMYENGETEIADKVYYLNKMLNSVDLFYAIRLPEIWSCEHPLGTVMGRAEYGDHFFFYQGCTVGGNYNKGVLEYPVIGENVTMYSNSKVLGNSHIGNRVLISANCYIINEKIPDNSLVFGQSPNLIIKARKD